MMPRNSLHYEYGMPSSQTEREDPLCPNVPIARRNQELIMFLLAASHVIPGGDTGSCLSPVSLADLAALRAGSLSYSGSSLRVLLFTRRHRPCISEGAA